MAKPLAKLVALPTPKRRWAQFSLLSLFLVVTVLCVGLSLVVTPAERQRRAVAAIESLGGSVEYEEPDQEASEAFPRPFLRRWLPQDYFDEVREVHFTRAPVTDDGLEHLRGLTGLQVLFLGGAHVTDSGLTHLQRLTGLEALWLNGTQVTDAGLAHLQGLTKLKSLDFSSTQVTDAGLVNLQRLSRLEWLDLTDTQVTNAGRAELQQALPNCRINGP
ncbi:MAG TPA: hypothetical protein VND64_17260 [Pirellulales bacterium]|nr:hypothetical protein [Pirellulales bacterium]